MSGREDEAMDGVRKGGGQEGGHGRGGVRWYMSGDGAEEGATGGVASGAGMMERVVRRRVYTQNVRYQKIEQNGYRET